MKAVRRVFLAMAILSAVFVGSLPASGQTNPEDEVEAVLDQLEKSLEGLDLDEIENLDELGPNPWLSLTPRQDAKSIEAWQTVAAQLPAEAQLPLNRRAERRQQLTYSEKEDSGQVGENDTAKAGDFIRRFGTKQGEQGAVTISGSLSGGVVRPPIQGDCGSTEDDGSIAQANPTPAAEIQVALCVGEIGDGPFGETSGDIDFYSFGNVQEGSVLIIDTLHVSNSLNPANTIVGIYDSSGTLLASGEDDGNINDQESFIETIASADGEYFAAVAGCCELSSDASDPASGPGAGATGTYEVFLVAFPPPCASVEDDGSIAQANPTNVNGDGFEFCTGIIGDGPHGSADTDFYSLGSVEVGAFGFFGAFPAGDELSTVIGLYNAEGELLASSESSGNPESEPLQFDFTESGEYFVAVSGCCDLQTDANNSASGVPSDQSGLYDVLLEVSVPFVPTCFSTEDDGAISSANDASEGFAEGDLFIIDCFDGVVGDGPQAEANGDVDFYRTRLLPADRTLIVDFLAFDEGSTGAGDLIIGIYSEAGELLATGQDDPSDAGPASEFFSFDTPEEGIYYVAIGGAMPTDPDDPTTGTNTDIVGEYNFMTIVDVPVGFFASAGAVQGQPSWSTADRSANAAASFRLRSRAENRPLATLMAKMESVQTESIAAADEPETPTVDVDFYRVYLRKGDAISGGFDSARTLGIIDPAGVQRSGSEFNPSFIYPEASPLRHDRRNGFDHVATVNGTHAVFVTDGIGEYEGELRVVKSGLASEQSQNQQIIYVDFDGAQVDAEVFGTVDANLSPLSTFLPAWGLDPNDSDAVIDATLDAITETIDQDLRVLDGRNGNRDRTLSGTQFDVKVLNSRDHGELWGQKNVTRIIIGGTIDELQIPTLGIAESIDPGNTETEETAVVLLDLISGPAGDDISINSYEVASGSTKAEFVGFAVGHVAAHEIGHLIGNWHQETFNEVDALMDAGGDFAAISGVGADGIFGTADDTDPNFKEDIFNTGEGFVGVEDSSGRSVFAFSTGSKSLYRRN